MRDLNAILTIAYRDLLKFVRDRPRLISSFVFPFVFILALGGMMDASFGRALGYSFLAYTFTGVLAQTLFQSSAFGLISLVEDRENDFSQEIFIAPISRYSIVFGKIVGESLVSLAQAVGIVVFGLLVGVSMTAGQALALLPVAVVVCLLGGAFGLAIMANLGSRRAIDQIFPFVMLPQFFLAGVFNPLENLPVYLDVISHMAPLRYAVDLMRAAYYVDQPEYPRVVLDGPLVDLVVVAAMFAVFLVLGTLLFVRSERNR